MDIAFLIAILATAFCFTTFVMPAIIGKMVKAGVVGHDVNKIDRPQVAEMGGIAIALGVVGSLLLVLAFNVSSNSLELLAALSTMGLIVLIGACDDLYDMRKDVKTILPMIAAIPIIAVAGNTVISIPFIGSVDFGIVYLVVLIPLGVTVASNLTNMLAGFNGMEAGMGIVIFSAVTLIAINRNEIESALIAGTMVGALLAFLRFNWYPAKVFMGDVGTLFIGGTLAVVVVIGKFEVVGFILVIPYLIDFVIKAVNRFPSKDWWGELTIDGKMHPLNGKVRGLCQLVMKLTGGVTEEKMVRDFIVLETVFALIAIALYGGVV